MRPAVPSRRRARLIRQLRAAHDSLAEWDASLRALESRPAPGSPHDPAELIAIVADAKDGLNRLLAQMGAEAAEEAGASVRAAARPRSGRKSVRPRIPQIAEASRMSVNAARACGRALGAAFREAQAAADAAATRLLYSSLRALEKQLWVLDPRQPR